MRCYVHRDVEAIGVCSQCGQGICDSCAVRIGGKLYCKEDADKIFSPLKKEAEEEALAPPERPMRFSVSSVLMVIYGIFGIGLAILFISAGLATGFVASVPSLDSLALTSVGLLALGGLFLVMGILGIVSGIWLWGRKLYGIYGGIPILTIGCMVVIVLGASVQTLATWEITGTVMAINIVLLTLLLACWNKLRPELF